jgi:sarcosine oxidase subunit beta
VDPLRTTWAFARAAQRLGAQIILGEPVTGIVVRRGRVAAVKTAKRSIACSAAVNCAGSWGGEVARLAGVELPITPRRGQLLVSEPLPPVNAWGDSTPLSLHRERARVRVGSTGPSMLCACYLTHKSRRIKAGDDMLVSFSMEQTVEGNLVIGSTRESAGDDRSVTPEGMAAITAHARRVAPGLADVHIIRAFAGLRPCTPDGLPFIGETEVRGFWAACGHEGDGIATTPATGDLLAALLTADAPPVAAAPFSPTRLTPRSS